MGSSLPPTRAPIPVACPDLTRSRSRSCFVFLVICSDRFRPVFAAVKPAAAAVLLAVVLAVVLAEITSLLQVQRGPAALISSTGKSVVVRDAETTRRDMARPRGSLREDSDEYIPLPPHPVQPSFSISEAGASSSRGPRHDIFVTGTCGHVDCGPAGRAGGLRAWRLVHASGFSPLQKIWSLVSTTVMVFSVAWFMYRGCADLSCQTDKSCLSRAYLVHISCISCVFM